MKIGFKINLGNFQMMSVESSEHDDWADCMKEVFNFLRRLEKKPIQDFVKDFLSVRVREEMKKRVVK